MTPQTNNGIFANLKNDLPASIVVFLVAVPLCLGIAIASGAPPLSGVIAGFIGGIVVGALSGSSLGVSGPAAGLVAIVLPAIQDLGFEAFLMSVVIAGVIQVGFGLVRMGVIAYYFPSAVIKGMLAGIGVIIILKQIPHAFGYDKGGEGFFGFLQADGHNTLTELGYAFESLSPGATIIAAISMAILILWERPFMKKIPVFKIIQGPLVAVATGIGLNMYFSGNATLALQPDQVVNIPVAESIGGFFQQFTYPDFGQWLNPQVYLTGGIIALVASLETLLCVEATDKLDPRKRITPTNRELIAQGIGNAASGLIGGLPVTQVIVRSSANIQSGGQTKISAIIHGLLLLFCAMSIPQVLNMVPLASLAAILLVVGYKLAKPKLAIDVYRKGIHQFLPFIITILGIVFTDLLIGISLGLVVAIIDILWNNFRTPYHFDPDSYVKGEPITISLSEDVSFLNKASIMQTLQHLPEDSKVIIDLSKTRSLHPDIMEIIDDFQASSHEHNIKVRLKGLTKRFRNDSVEQLGDLVLKGPLGAKRKKSGDQSDEQKKPAQV